MLTRTEKSRHPRTRGRLRVGACRRVLGAVFGERIGESGSRSRAFKAPRGSHHGGARHVQRTRYALALSLLAPAAWPSSRRQSACLDSLDNTRRVSRHVSVQAADAGGKAEPLRAGPRARALRPPGKLFARRRPGAGRPLGLKPNAPAAVPSGRALTQHSPVALRSGARGR